MEITVLLFFLWYKKYNCKIILINKDVNAERSAEVHCRFEHWDKDPVPGMFMNAEIEQSNQQAYVLPEEAVVNYENQSFVFVAKDSNRFEMIPVQTGIVKEGKTEIKFTKNDLLQKSFVFKGACNLLRKLKNTEEE